MTWLPNTPMVFGGANVFTPLLPIRLLASRTRPSVATCCWARADAGKTTAGSAASAAANNHCVVRDFVVITLSGCLESMQYIAEPPRISSENHPPQRDFTPTPAPDAQKSHLHLVSRRPRL